MDHVRSHDAFMLGNVVLNHSQTAHLVELDSGFTKSELRGHDNVVESALFIPVSCIPAIRELLGQKVLSFHQPFLFIGLIWHTAEGSTSQCS
jgi:hypothetical protein